MRVDTSQLLATGGIKLKAGTGSGLDSLRKGDVLRAEVVSRDKSGMLTLKMENGHSFSAKLDTGLRLSVGDALVLEVMEKDNDRISLSFSSAETAEDDLSLAERSIVREFSDKSLAPYASKLSELGMPVNEKSAALMRDLMALNPKLTLDEAAFLVSNKLTDDPDIMQAALRMLASGEKTDALIAKLISSMGEPSIANPEATQTQNTAPLTNLLAAIVKNSSSLMEALNHLNQAPSSGSQGIITQSEGNMQTNVINVAENLSQVGNNSEIATQQGTAQTQQPQVLQGTQASTLPGTLIGENFSNNMPTGEPAIGDGLARPANVQTATMPTPLGDGFARPDVPQAATPLAAEPPVGDGLASPGSPLSQNPESGLRSMVVQLLSQVPEFSGTPHSALERFSEMLLRVAGDTVGAADGETLEAQIEKLFTKIDAGGANAGTELRHAREELFARLAMLEEAVSSSNQNTKTELLSQTHRLMDHVRTLNNIEQFVYMQMPVSQNDQRKSAELYIFKRKGRRQADSENVNILMAIDLEFMGRWEALLNIKGKDVTLNMEVRGETEKKHFGENTVLLHRLLDEDGFRLVATNIKLFKEETTPLNALTALDRYQGKKQTGIDIKW
ncbi:MAG: hypothetical protein FWC20_02590 [Oscillospiraceae bacterium]|nr:hypothetical protein [Oscillospiraceae bacterium]MCL2278282.1 hypothetical protein [Oscillospiraceae bacterium]